MRHTELVQARTGGSIEQVKLIPLAAVDVERLQPREIVGLSLDRDHRVLPQPVSPALLDDLAGVEDDRQADRRRTCSCVLLRRGRFRTPLFRRPERPSRVPASALWPFRLAFHWLVVPWPCRLRHAFLFRWVSDTLYARLPSGKPPGRTPCRCSHSRNVS